jgi:DNA-binding MarR family transcriptional regulator
MIGLDEIVRISNMVQMTRSIVAPHLGATGISTTAMKAGIIADFRASMGELKCIGSERLVRQGISMSQLHVMNLLERHGEMPMSRLADMIDVSVSNATGLVDRIEERGFLERDRVATDRRVVLVRISAAGRAVLDEVEALREEVLRSVLDRMTDTQLTRVAAALSDMRQAIDTTLADPASPIHHVHEAQGRD